MVSTNLERIGPLTPYICPWYGHWLCGDSLFKWPLALALIIYFFSHNLMVIASCWFFGITSKLGGETVGHFSLQFVNPHPTHSSPCPYWVWGDKQGRRNQGGHDPHTIFKSMFWPSHFWGQLAQVETISQSYIHRNTYILMRSHTTPRTSTGITSPPSSPPQQLSSHSLFHPKAPIILFMISPCT